MCNLSLEKESQLIKDWSPSTSQVRPPGPPGAIFYLHSGDFCQPANFSLDYSTFCPDLLAHSRERPNLACKQRSRTLHICAVFSAIKMFFFLPTYPFPLKSVISLILTRGSDYGMRIFCGLSSAHLGKLASHRFVVTSLIGKSAPSVWWGASEICQLFSIFFSNLLYNFFSIFYTIFSKFFSTLPTSSVKQVILFPDTDKFSF